MVWNFAVGSGVRIATATAAPSEPDSDGNAPAWAAQRAARRGRKIGGSQDRGVGEHDHVREHLGQGRGLLAGERQDAGVGQHQPRARLRRSQAEPTQPPTALQAHQVSGPATGPDLDARITESLRDIVWFIRPETRTVGDLAETIALVLPRGDAVSVVGLAEWVEDRLLPLRGLPDDEVAQRVASYWRAHPRPERLWAEMDEEMRFHVDMEAERLQRERGLDPAEAAALHGRATAVRSKAMHLWASVRGTVASPFFRDSPVDTVSGELKGTFENLPSYQDLFGTTVTRLARRAGRYAWASSLISRVVMLSLSA